MDNGADAVTKAPKKAYDLILMDIQMPVLDGNQAATQLRQAGYTRPIVAITAHAMLEEKEKAFASGFDDYLLKPIQKSKLLDVLMKFAAVKTS